MARFCYSWFNYLLHDIYCTLYWLTVCVKHLNFNKVYTWSLNEWGKGINYFASIIEEFKQTSIKKTHHYELWRNRNGPFDLCSGTFSCLPLIDWEWDLDFGFLKQIITNLEYDESSDTQCSYDDWSQVKIPDQLESIDPCLLQGLH
jgi:hypothetical protein